MYPLRVVHEPPAVRRQLAARCAGCRRRTPRTAASARIHAQLTRSKLPITRHLLNELCAGRGSTLVARASAAGDMLVDPEAPGGGGAGGGGPAPIKKLSKAARSRIEREGPRTKDVKRDVDGKSVVFREVSFALASSGLEFCQANPLAAVRLAVRPTPFSPISFFWLHPLSWCSLPFLPLLHSPLGDVTPCRHEGAVLVEPACDGCRCRAQRAAGGPSGESPHGSHFLGASACAMRPLLALDASSPCLSVILGGCLFLSFFSPPSPWLAPGNQTKVDLWEAPAPSPLSPLPPPLARPRRALIELAAPPQASSSSSSSAATTTTTTTFRVELSPPEVEAALLAGVSSSPRVDVAWHRLSSGGFSVRSLGLANLPSLSLLLLFDLVRILPPSSRLPARAARQASTLPLSACSCSRQGAPSSCLPPSGEVKWFLWLPRPPLFIL